MNRWAVLTGKPIDRKYQYVPGVGTQRAGLLFISGMVGWDAEGNIVAVGDPAGQARQAFENLKDVLTQAGCTFDDIVMETEYVVDMNHYPQIGRVRKEYFTGDFPAATLVEVRRLFKPELLFEIQAIAVLPQ
jgi:enamine deaminase RidA (YjgF/YER057c/UK114 family)